MCYLLAKPSVSVLLFPPTATLQNVGGGVGMFDSALAFFEEGSLLAWTVRRSRVSLAFGVA